MIDWYGVKVNHTEVFVEVLRYRKIFTEINGSSADNLEYRCNYTVKWRTEWWKVKGS